MKYLTTTIAILISIGLTSCTTSFKNNIIENNMCNKSDSLKISTKPSARYWWFASEIKKEDVKYNLDWLKKNGFGGVEIAWVYPLNAKNKAILYDYRKLISEKVIDFYSDFDRVLNEKGILSQGQYSGAPCDIISAYAQLDIPEGESMLYEPEFNSIPASATLLSGKSTVL